MPDTPSLVESVAQIDREAAAALIEEYWCGAGEGHDNMRRLAGYYRAGHSQGVWAVAFARHRKAAISEMFERMSEPSEAVVEAGLSAMHRVAEKPQFLGQSEASFMAGISAMLAKMKSEAGL